MLWYQYCFGNLPLKNLNERKLAKYETDREFINNFQRLFNLSLNTFEWTGLPETCNERFLEMSLLLYGAAIIVEQEGAYINLAFAQGANINVYGEPMNGYGYGLNGFNKEYNLYIDGAEQSSVVVDGIAQKGSKKYDAVMCRDSRTAYPYVNYLLTAAQRLTRAMRTMDVISQNLKQPVIITCEESMVNSVKENLNQRGDNVSAIISSGKLPIDSFKVWDTKVNPDTLKVMWEHFERLDSQVKELMGINNLAQVDKKERLLVDEVNANNEATEESVEHRLVERQKFCERVNKAFGLEISVKLRQPVENSHGAKNEEEEVIEDVED